MSASIELQAGWFGGWERSLPAIPTLRTGLLLFMAAAGGWGGAGGAGATDQAPLGTPRFSVAIQPFANLSSDPTQASFAEAISDRLPSALARLRGGLAIAQNEKVPVRYTLKGSVQATGDNVEISAELIDAESGAHIWKDQFEIPRSAAFRMQDKIAARLTRGIYLQLPQIETEQLKRAPASTPNAEDLAVACQESVLTNEIVFVATNTVCDQALAADPENVLALTWSAFRLMPSFGRGHDGADDLKEADARLSKALATDPTYAPAHLAKAFALQSQFRLDEAMSEDRRAIALDPSLADAYWHLGLLLRRTCKYRASLESIDEAIWLSPSDPFRSVWYAEKAGSHIALKEYEQAAEAARRAVAINPRRGGGYFFLLVALALAGEESQAREALQGYLSTAGPNRTVARWRAVQARWVNAQTDPCYLEHWDVLFEGLRKAGMPEE